jgi:hypothetical protein
MRIPSGPEYEYEYEYEYEKGRRRIRGYCGAHQFWLITIMLITLMVSPK